MIALVAVTPGGRGLAQRLAAAWPDRTTVHSGPAADQLAAAWPNADAVVCFLATGATVRLIAPLLADKHTDPGVVCVDEAGRFAVALCGGHDGGANALAESVARVLGATPVVTTATDAVGITPLDGFGADLGFHLATPERVARATTAVLSGAEIRVRSDATWPVPPLPAPTSTGVVTLVVSDRRDAVGDLVYRPPSLVVGVGASRGAPAEEISALIDAALEGLAPESVRAIATADIKADEPGIRAVAQARGWPVVTFTAAELSTVDVPNPSEVVRDAVGTPSVAEAAALRAAGVAGRRSDLVVQKLVGTMSTVAVARVVPRGRLTLVGLGPGAEDLRAPRAERALRRASVVVGLDQYVDQIRHLLPPGTRVEESGLGAEEERAATAVALATAGHAVALIGSGDAGIYAMASPALQLAGDDVDVEAVPGITAAVAAAARLGAPLGHDHAYLSLSDLHTPWPVIEERVRACAVADLVVCLYNPRSLKRRTQFGTALDVLRGHRPKDTPVGIVRDATRPGERVTLTTLADLDEDAVDMLSVVIVGSSRTTLTGGRMVTPREYRWLA
ncbi:precorrin-3B C(17)-methyltransferase [Virgisporangium aliadipatigenens]|uniref:Precorrin-3B C(17)-methyltransferase n=1 Tax=Virgisporangium aliadipatigenens TaxID=741659 RepID=A0A8J4DSV0_9ACTN|nr:precorrin-3B C(17)-methyltransferase [Virgisporangium aliadipatigenens]GIJ47607.1 precorrin-3B C(17)-methyltransferase [Virgisporangium aliadipatigenens]